MGATSRRELVAEGYPAWVAPTGGHDAYNTGDRVSFEGSKILLIYQSILWLIMITKILTN